MPGQPERVKVTLLQSMWQSPVYDETFFLSLLPVQHLEGSYASEKVKCRSTTYHLRPLKFKTNAENKINHSLILKKIAFQIIVLEKKTLKSKLILEQINHKILSTSQNVNRNLYVNVRIKEPKVKNKINLNKYWMQYFMHWSLLMANWYRTT